MTATQRKQNTVNDPDQIPRAALDKWLERVGAKLMWRQKIKPGGWYMEAWRINQRIVIVQDWEPDGWELYIPASDKNDVESTLDETALRLGVEGCAGLL